MNTVPIYTVNNYYRLSDLAAMSCLKWHHQLKTRQQKLSNHHAKYSKVLNQNAGEKFPFVVAVPAHLAVAILEGVILAPLFRHYLKGLILHTSLLEVLIYFPVLIFCGISLMIGKYFQEIQWEKDGIHPTKRHFTVFTIIKAISFTAAYLLFLNQLTTAAMDRLGENGSIAIIIFCMGAAELILGFFAVVGWEITYAHLALYWSLRRVKDCKNKIQQRAHECEQNYAFYTQALRINNHVEEMNQLPKMNSRIKWVLYKGEQSVEDAAVEEPESYSI